MVASVTKRPDRPSRSGGRLARRFRKEWPVRTGLAALVAALGYANVSFTLAEALRRDAERAHALAPYDGRMTARLAGVLSGPEATASDRSRGDDLARKALRQDPVNVPAAAALGFNAQVRGDVATARRAFTYAERLSRRDPMTQLWAIEEAVARNDIGDAVRHYDIALRVKPEMSEVLFPVLAAASVEAPVQAQLVRTLTAKPPWSEGFVNFVAARGTNPQATVVLLQRLDRARVKTPDTAKAALLNALFSSGQIDRAWAYYATIRAGVSRDRARDPGFARQPDVPTSFDWVTVGDGGIVGTIEKGGFDFSAPASVGGPMLQQVQLLPPGDYRLRGHSTDVDQPDGTLPYWTLVCQDGRELGRVTVSRSSQSGGRYAGMLRVPQDCPVQTLVLVARPSDNIAGLSGRIDHAALEPLPRGGRT
ncbi:tetratricopeptide repeat protein [Sphingomonas olei]